MAYAQEVAEGYSLKRTQQPDIKTIQGYVRAAANISVAAGLGDPRFLDHATDKQGQRIYVPLLQRVFDVARKWTPPKRPERQAITILSIMSLLSKAQNSRYSPQFVMRQS